MTQASLWRHNGYQGVTEEAAMTMVCYRPLHSGWFEAIFERFSVPTHPNRHKFTTLCGIMVEEKLIPRFSLGLASPVARQSHLTPWVRLGVWSDCRVPGDATLTSISISIPKTFIWRPYCRIWCEKHGPRDSVDKNRGWRPRFLSLLRSEGDVFHTAWETMTKSNYSTLADFFSVLFT